MTYYVDTSAPVHTCWNDPEWDGEMHVDCAGCDAAAANPCYFCGYGHAFTTHSDLAHAENGDNSIVDESWYDFPHIPIIEEVPIP